MNFGVSFLFVAARELTAAYVARERFLSGVRSYVRGKVVGARKRTHTDATLEWFLTGVNANVSGEFVGT